MKTKFLFTFLLIAIVFIGFNGTNIANRFFGINDIEQTSVSKSSVKSGAIYMSSYNEISFDPMAIIDYPSKKSTFIDPSRDIVFGFSSEFPFTLSDMIGMLIRHISSYSDKTTYAEPFDMDIEKTVYVDSNDYFFVEKHKYYNPSHEERYVDMILDSKSFSIIYLNFYDDTKYDPTSAQIQKGVSRLQEYSNSYYDSIIKSKDIDNWIFGSYTIDALNEIYDDAGLQEHPEYYFDATIYEAKEILDAQILSVCDHANIAAKVSGAGNPVIKFFMNVTAPSLIMFEDEVGYGEKFYGEINDQEPFKTTFQLWSTYHLFYDILYNSSSPYENADYAHYNGRIYQTINTNDSEKYVIIYNIVTNEIEGFYVKPIERLW